MSEPITVVGSHRPRITDAQLAEHDRLVCWVVRRQCLAGLAFQDALQAGRIGLWHALQHYDPGRGTRFSTYAVVAIQRAVWQAVREHQAPRSSGQPALPGPIVGELPEPVELVHRAQVRAELRRLVATLPERLRLVIVAHHGLSDSPPQTFEVIGRALGLTRQRVHQLHVEALLWLAHPARSRALRALLDRQSRRDYQHALARQHHWRRLRRGRQGVGR